MGAFERNKGRRGQSEFANVLTARDWKVDPITAGVKREDIVATDPDGNAWSVEVKNTTAITSAHKTQAMAQAKLRGLRWMLASKIAGTRFWLVQRQGVNPIVWEAHGQV